MPAEDHQTPARREADAEAIDFEVVDDGRGVDHSRSAAEGPEAAFSPEDLAAMAPGMIVKAFRSMLKQKLKRWFIRSLIWCTVLLIFYQDHGWARVAFAIWAFVASVHLAFLLYGWYVSGRQGAKLAQVFGGVGGMPGRMREP